MNEGDVFVLDNKSHIFVWVGTTSNSKERMYAAKVFQCAFNFFLSVNWIIVVQFAQTLKGEHGMANSVIVILEDGNELALPDGEREVFDSLLPTQSKKAIYIFTV